MKHRVFVAIDTDDLDHAKSLAREVGPITGGIKLGLEFFNTFGPDGIDAVASEAKDTALFIDLKYHDIPNTVAGAVRAICKRVRPAYLNVHAVGGLEMMQAAKAACAPETKLIGVTVLTSMNADQLNGVGVDDTPETQVLRLAKLTQEAGLDGVVCSAKELVILNKEIGGAFDYVVPGIRPAGADLGDQKRVMTPKDAITAGATHLVIGRPITQAENPATAAANIMSELI